AGRHAGGETAAGGDRIDLVERGLEQFLQRRVVLGGAAFGDLVYLGLGAVDDLVDLLAVGAVVAVLHDARAGLDQATQHRLVCDDLGVVRGVGRRRHGRDQG